MRRSRAVSDDERAFLFALTQHIAEGESVEAILEVLVARLAPLIPFDRLEYSLVQADGYELRTEWVHSLGANPVPLGYVYRRPEPVATSHQYRVPFVDRDLVEYAKDRPPEHPVAMLAAGGFHSSLACPLVFSDTVVGFLFFNSRTPGVYGDEHVGLVRAIASQLAFALELRRLHGELEGRHRELDLLHVRQRQLVGFVSHELRNALTIVSGVAAELEGREELVAADAHDLVRLLGQHAERAVGLSEDLLVAMRDEEDVLHVDPAAVDLTTEVVQVVDGLRLVGVRFQWDEGVPVEVVADPMRVRQVVRNLLTNADRYGGERLRVEVSSCGEGSACVRVIDDGDGVSEGFATRLFEPYAQEGVRRLSGSNGLGLAVSRRLMVAMGGALEYRRVDGETIFEARFPTS